VHVRNHKRWWLLLAAALLLLPPMLTAAPQFQAPPVTLAESAQGRPIEVYRFGDGPRKLVIIGATHGGAERNTYELSLALIDWLAANPQAIPADMRVLVIPALNPDGLALEWRFDGAGVDLNRNMDTRTDACAENDWQRTVQGAYGTISDTGGDFPESQREAQIVRHFVFDASAAIFLHSAAGLVFPAGCGHEPSRRLAEVYANGAGYQYVPSWDRYQITGGMHDWAGGLGIAAITPELLSGTLPEIEQNIAGLQAVLAGAAELIPPLVEETLDGVELPAELARFRRALHGDERLGVPLAAAEPWQHGVRQRFSRAVLVSDERLRDTLGFVQLADLGRDAFAAQAYGRPGDGSDVPTAAAAALTAAWQRAGGALLYGLPLSPPVLLRWPDGSLRAVQYFERTVLVFDEASGSVEPAELGLRQQQLEQLISAPANFMIR
jgi:predicted deacylase